MKTRASYPQEVRERATRMVFEHQSEHQSVGRDLLHRHRVQDDAGDASSLGPHGRDRRRHPPRPHDRERERLKALERENRERRRANEILKSASAFLAAKLDRPARR